jgi:hypothetical protein
MSDGSLERMLLGIELGKAVGCAESATGAEEPLDGAADDADIEATSGVLVGALLHMLDTLLEGEILGANALVGASLTVSLG